MVPVMILCLLLRVLGSTKKNAALQASAPSPPDESYNELCHLGIREERILKESGIDRAYILGQSQQVIQET